MEPLRAALHFTQGSSDKVYNIVLDPMDGGWIVNFSYGRRGKPLKHGTKTAQPVRYELARAAYDRLLQEKVAKGYRCNDEATFVDAGGATIDSQRTGWVPQLLNPIEEENVSDTLVDFGGRVYLQTKHDGERRAIHWDGNRIYASNRRGLEVAISAKLMETLQDWTNYHGLKPYLLDCEDLGEELVIFDVCEWDGEDIREKNFAQRSHVLWDICAFIAHTNAEPTLSVDLGGIYDNLDHIRHFIQINKNAGQEGIVLRDTRAPYTEGRPNSGGPARKLKFYASATCTVASIHPTKRSIGLQLLNAGMPLDVGNCTIPPNYEMPEIDDTVEIKYLYAYRGGSIYQPQYKGVRTDIPPYECTTDQLKYKD